jgi:hypothetical protein
MAQAALHNAQKFKILFWEKVRAIAESLSLTYPFVSLRLQGSSPQHKKKSREKKSHTHTRTHAHEFSTPQKSHENAGEII